MRRFFTTRGNSTFRSSWSRNYPPDMSQFHFKPDDYLRLMYAEIPSFDELQDRAAAASAGFVANRILELGTGTGETARRVLRHHPEARLTGLDVSAEMLAQARQILPPDNVQLLVQDMVDPLPRGPFDLVFSALSVHHLDGPGKADLFHRVARVLRPRGRFVMADVVIPVDAADAVTPLSPGYDMPSSIEDLLRWLRDAGFHSHLVWSSKDLAIIRSDLRA